MEEWVIDDDGDDFTGTISGTTVTVTGAWDGANGTYTLAQ
jgi:hypothetical protein